MVKRHRLDKQEQSEEDVSDRVKTISKLQKENGGFEGSVNVGETKNPRLKAYTNMQTKETDILFSPDYATEQGVRLYAFSRDATAHEINHHNYKGVHKGHEFKGCPRNLDLGTKLIFEPIYNVLRPKKFSYEDASYLENCLEDDILHSDLSPVFNLNGISYFFDEVGQSTGFTPFYDAHVKLNQMLWGNTSQYANLKRHFIKDKKTAEKIDHAIKEFTSLSGLQGLDVSFSHIKSPQVLEDRLKIREFLNNESNWPKISKAYAKAFSKLMTPNYARPLPNHSGAGTKGREEEDKSKEGNEFQRQRVQKEYKMGRIQEAYKSGEKMPSWIESFEGLDLFYQGQAKRLAFDVKSFTETTAMPVLHYGERRYRPYSDNLSNVTFGFGPTAQLELRKREHSIDIQIPVRQSTIGFPKSRFIIMDTSSSMKEDFNGGNNTGSKLIVPWGDKSKYHATLIEWYGLLEWLKENHLLERTGISLHNFSDKTIVGNGLEEAKRIALKPQWGDTYLDADRIKDLSQDKGSFIVSFSDGHIANWTKIWPEYSKVVANNYFVHFQYGAETPMCKDIRKSGGHVDIVRTADEVRGRTIKIANKFYRGGAQ